LLYIEIWKHLHCQWGDVLTSNIDDSSLIFYPTGEERERCSYAV
jgi:hypothetical protein